MPAKIPKPTILTADPPTKNGFLDVFGKSVKQNLSNLSSKQTQKTPSTETKQSNDVQKYLKDYLLAVEKTGCSSSTVRNYKSDINQFLDFLGSKDVNDLRNKPKLLAFAHYQRDKGLKENSVKRKLVSIGQFKIWLKQQGQLSSEIPLSTVSANLQEKETKNDSEKAKEKRTEDKINIKDETKKAKRPHSRLMIVLNLLALLLFLGGLAYFAYQQFGQAIISMASPNTPVAPNRILSYQGRLTNTSQSPISTPTAMTYALYDTDEGGSLLWSSNTCTIDPDQDGIFNTNLGAGVGNGSDNEDCGGTIGEEVFTENANVWLEVAIGAETLTPRQPIRTVAYAINSSTLRGLAPAEVASNSTILMMNDSGEVVLGTDNPVVKTASTSSGMTIEANRITIQTRAGSNGDIVLAPDGTGMVDIQGDASVSGSSTLVGNVYLGSTNSLIFGGTTALGEISSPTDSGAYLIGAYDEFSNSNSTNVQGVLNDLDAAIVSAGTPKWSNLAAPTSNLSLNHSTYTTVFNWATGIGSNDLFSLTTDTNSDGTGSLLNLQTGTGSTVSPLRVRAGSTEALFVDNSGKVGIGTTNPTEKLTIQTGNILLSNDYSIAFGNTGNIITGSSATNHIRFNTNSTEKMRLDTNGNLGIGTTSPSYKLDVAGDINLTGALRVSGNTGTAGQVLTSTGTGVSWAAAGGSSNWQRTLGSLAPLNITDDVNLGATATSSALVHLPGTVDQDAWFNLGTGNVGMGTTSPTSLLTLKTVSSEESSPGAGVDYPATFALLDSTDTSSFEIRNSSASLYNTFIGKNSGARNTTGSKNIALGSGALSINTTGIENTAIGVNALSANTTGNLNVSVGRHSLYANTTGNDNSAIGTGSLVANTTGYGNAAVGRSSLQGNLSGHYNSAIGNYALSGNTTGNSNSAIGYNAGHYYNGTTGGLTSASNSLFLGTSTSALADGGTNEIVIGHNAIGNGSNSVTLGNDSITKTILKGNVGIGTTNPTAKLSFAADTTPAGGIDFGGDTNLYRVYANILQTDDEFWSTSKIGVNTTGDSTIDLNTSSGTAVESFRFLSSNILKHQFGNYTGNNEFFIDSYNSSNVKKTSLTLNADTLLFNIDPNNEGWKLTFGGDTNLYRSAANQLKTDDSLFVNGNLGVGVSPTYKLDVLGDINVREALRANGNAGTAGQVLTSTGTGVSWAAAGGSSNWQRTLGSLAPLNITDDVNLGATATSSALVHLPGTVDQDAWFNLGTGNVGIGTTSPLYKLDINGGSSETAVARFASADDLAKIYISDNDTTGFLSAKDNNLLLGTNLPQAITTTVSGNDPWSLDFSSDGTKIYYRNGNAPMQFSQYNLSTAWNVSTATSANKSFNPSTQETMPFGLAFNSNGTKMYIVGYNSTIFQYTLSTGWDISTASYASKSFAVSQTTFPAEIQFNSDGTKMYVLGPSDTKVFQYTLSTGWDISTASYANKSFNVAGSYATDPYDFKLSSDGTKLYVHSLSKSKIFQFSLGTAWDISTASYSSKTFDTSVSDAFNFVFNSNGTKIYTLDSQTGLIKQYAMSTAWDISSASQDMDSVSLNAMAININGNIGIGTTAPGSHLTIQASTANEVAFALYDTAGNSNFEIRSTMSANENTFIGKGAGAVTTGSYNLALGVNALNANTTGFNNSAQGNYTLYSNTTGYENTAVGVSALQDNTTGYENTAVGVTALPNNITGSSNSALGFQTLYFNTIGSNNSAQGNFALYSNTTGSSNSALGTSALSLNTIGSYNSALGFAAGSYYNGNAGDLTSATNSLFLGASSSALADGGTNEIVIGANAIGLGSNSVVLGNDSIATTALRGNVGIGTTSPSYKLDVAGDINLTGALRANGNAGTAGQVLTSTGTGVSWAAAGGSSNWQRTLGSLAPLNIADDINLGAIATSSALVHLPGTNNQNAWFNLGTGNVGIGTTDPAQKLDVSGKIALNGTQALYMPALWGNLIVGNGGNNISHTTGNDGYANTFVGIDSGLANTTGFQNSALGTGALAANTTGFENIAIGAYSLYNNTTGYSNSALGSSALSTNTTGFNNSAFGKSALAANSTGSNNTALGTQAGMDILGGMFNFISSDSLYLGAFTRALADGDTNEIVIGYNAIGNGSNSATLGNDSITKTILKGNVGIGTTDPTAKLQIGGAASVISNDSGDITLDAASGNIAFSSNNLININDGLFSGSVGIGSVSPDRKLEIVDGSNPQLRLTYTEGSIYSDFQMNANGDLLMNVDGVSNQLVLDNGGNVGVGLTNPDEKLTVNGSVNAEKYYDYTNKSYFLDPAAASLGLKLAGNAEIGGTVTSQDLLSWTDNTYALGSSTNRWKDLFLGPSSLHISSTTGTTGVGSNYVDGSFGYSANALTLSTAITGTVAGGGSINLQSGLASGSATIAAFNFSTAADLGASDELLQIGDLGGTALTVLGNGNVGVGTTNPGAKLEIASSANGTELLKFGTDRPWSFFQRNTGAATTLDLRSSNSSKSFTITTPDAKELANFYAESIADGGSFVSLMKNQFVVLNNGNVGIGTTSPGAKLDVNGIGQFLGATQIGPVSQGFYGDSTNIALRTYNSSSSDIYFQTYGGAQTNMMIKNGGNVGIGTTSPSSRLHIVGSGAADPSLTANTNQITNFQVGSVQLASGIITSSPWAYWFQTKNTDNVGASYPLALNPIGGNVGIGTTSPAYKLDVTGDVRSSGAVISTNPNGLRIVSGNYGAFLRNDGGSTYLLMTASGDQYGSWSSIRPWYANNTSGYVTFGNGHNDLAENYQIEGKVLRAQLVSINQNRSYSAIAADQNNTEVFGVVSTAPGAVMDADGDGFKIGPPTQLEYNNEKTPIAIAGTAPVLITSQNGLIKLGDAIGISTTPGFGAKMIKSGQTVGKALEEINTNSCQVVSSVDAIVWPEDDGKNSLKPCFRLPDGTYVGKIMVAVAPSWYDPSAYLQVADLSLDQFGEVILTGTSASTYAVSTPVGIADRFSVFAGLASAQIKAGLLEAKELAAQVLTATTATITNLTAQVLNATTATIANLTAPNLETATITSSNDQLAIVADTQVSGDLAVQENLTIAQDLTVSQDLAVTGQSKLGALIAQDATISGTLIAQQLLTETATVSGELTAEQIRANELEANSARINAIETKLATIENATISGTLYAENIETNSISANVISGLQERLSEQIAETLTQPTLLATLFEQKTTQTDEYLNQLSQEINGEASTSADIASDSATLAELDANSDDLTLIADNAFINQYFEVNGNAYIANSLKLGQNLMIGTDTILGTDYLSYSPTDETGAAISDFTFYIQPSGLGKISLLAGLMQLDGQGFVTISGDLKVAGVLEVADDLKVKDTLLTNLIGAENPGESIQVQLASVQASTDSATSATVGDGDVQESNFEFVDENQTPVATFSANGDLALTGSLRLSQTPTAAAESEQLATGRSAGQATLPAGSTEVIIASDKLEANSMIYVTPMNSTNNQVLYVKDKVIDDSSTDGDGGTDGDDSGSSFTVAIDSALEQDVTFNWWLVQLN